MSKDANISIYVDFDINENAYTVQTQTGNIRQFDKTQAVVTRMPIEKGYIKEIVTEYNEIEDLFFFNYNKSRYNIRVPINSYIIKGQPKGYPLIFNKNLGEWLYHSPICCF